MNINFVISEANKILSQANIRYSKLDSEILLSKVLNKERDYIILNSNKELNKESYSLFKQLIKLRSFGKPIAYLIGKKEFWKYEFEINEGVLIPRPDTELIVEQVLKLTKNKSNLKVLDIGVGSGCILLSILKERKEFYGTGIDINKKAINLARINANKLDLLNRIKFFQSDVDNFSCGKYDLIISNPPYIKNLDLKYLDKDIIKYEPKTALDGGLDGLSEIRKVIKKSSELIKNNGILILEIAFNQKEKVKKLLFEEKFYINKILKDLGNNYRCIVCKKI